MLLNVWASLTFTSAGIQEPAQQQLGETSHPVQGGTRVRISMGCSYAAWLLATSPLRRKALCPAGADGTLLPCHILRSRTSCALFILAAHSAWKSLPSPTVGLAGGRGMWLKVALGRCCTMGAGEGVGSRGAGSQSLVFQRKHHGFRVRARQRGAGVGKPARGRPLPGKRGFLAQPVCWLGRRAEWGESTGCVKGRGQERSV